MVDNFSLGKDYVSIKKRFFDNFPRNLIHIFKAMS